MTDGFSHAGNGEEIHSLLDGAPVLFGKEDRVHSLSRNHNGLMRASGLSHEFSQIGFRFCGWDGRYEVTGLDC